MASASTEIVVNNAFVEGVYSKLGPLYDLVFGRVLQAGRVAAVSRMGNRMGTRVLEVGIGTGLNAPLYPRHFRVTGVDLSSDMLEQARERLAREGLKHIRLHQMDAAHLAFRDDTFDVVYAPYTISAVPDPIAVAREMRRVCRPGGTILLLNHFRSRNPLGAFVESAIAPLTIHVGFKSNLDLAALLAEARLKATRVERVNVPPIWSLVTCVNE